MVSGKCIPRLYHGKIGSKTLSLKSLVVNKRESILHGHICHFGRVVRLEWHPIDVIKHMESLYKGTQFDWLIKNA